MKILLLSDIHSNINALRAIEHQEQTWDVVLFAGDMVDFGLQPHEVVTWMREHDAIAVVGNHDTYLVKTYNEHGRSVEDPLLARSFCEHNLAMLTQEDMEYLAALPLETTVELDGITYFMTHIYDPQDEEALAHQLEQYRPISSFDHYWQEKVGTTQGKRCIVIGHHHHCMVLQLKADAMLINPGSASYKLGVDGYAKGAAYVVMEDGTPYFRWADFDLTEDYKTISEQMLNLGEGQRSSGLAIFGTW